MLESLYDISGSRSGWDMAAAAGDHLWFNLMTSVLVFTDPYDFLYRLPYHSVFSLETSPIHRSYLMRSAGFHLLSSIPLCLMSHWFLIDNENLFSSLITHALMNSRHGICLTSIRSSHSDTYTQDSSWPQKNIVCLRWSPKPSLRSPGR